MLYACIVIFDAIAIVTLFLKSFGCKWTAAAARCLSFYPFCLYLWATVARPYSSSNSKGWWEKKPLHLMQLGQSPCPSPCFNFEGQGAPTSVIKSTRHSDLGMDTDTNSHTTIYHILIWIWIWKLILSKILMQNGYVDSNSDIYLLLIEDKMYPFVCR